LLVSVTTQKPAEFGQKLAKVVAQVAGAPIYLDVKADPWEIAAILTPGGSGEQKSHER